MNELERKIWNIVGAFGKTGERKIDRLTRLRQFDEFKALVTKREKAYGKALLESLVKPGTVIAYKTKREMELIEFFMTRIQDAINNLDKETTK